MITPTINLNGSDPDYLATQLRAAVQALSTASDHVADTSPHGRDYPIPGAFQVARAEHDERLRQLTALREELKAIYISVRQQQTARLKQRGVSPLPADAEEL
jgi:hypothetical protein